MLPPCLEPARKDVQEAFFAVLCEVREVGVPTSRVREQLELVDDLLACLEVAVSAQVVHNAPALEAELRAAFGTGGEGPGCGVSGANNGVGGGLRQV